MRGKNKRSASEGQSLPKFIRGGKFGGTGTRWKGYALQQGVLLVQKWAPWRGSKGGRWPNSNR